MSEFRQYRRKPSIVLARPYVVGEDLSKISVTETDHEDLTGPGGMIFQNPKNPDDQWYIAEQYFSDHFDPEPLN